MQGNTIRIVIEEKKRRHEEERSIFTNLYKREKRNHLHMPNRLSKTIHNAKNLYHKIRSSLYIQNLGLY